MHSTRKPPTFLAIIVRYYNRQLFQIYINDPSNVLPCVIIVRVIFFNRHTGHLTRVFASFRRVIPMLKIFRKLFVRHRREPSRHIFSISVDEFFFCFLRPSLASFCDDDIVSFYDRFFFKLYNFLSPYYIAGR